MTTSILTSVKEHLGIDAQDASYDNQLVEHINRALVKCRQLGVGPKRGFVIFDETSEWSDLIPFEQTYLLADVPSFVGDLVRLSFDPPAGGSTMQALKDTIAEDEFRIKLALEVEQDLMG